MSNTRDCAVKPSNVPRRSVKSVMDELLRKGILLFNNCDFFQCHEVLEEAWTKEVGPRRLFLQALIHVAVGFYHWVAMVHARFVLTRDRVRTAVCDFLMRSRS